MALEIVKRGELFTHLSNPSENVTEDVSEGLIPPEFTYDRTFFPVIDQPYSYETSYTREIPQALPAYNPRRRMPPRIALDVDAIVHPLETSATEEVSFTIPDALSIYHAYTASAQQERYKYGTQFTIKSQPCSMIWSLGVEVIFERPLKEGGIIRVTWPSGEEPHIDIKEITSQKTYITTQQPYLSLQGGCMNVIVYGLCPSDIYFNKISVKLYCNYKATTFTEMESHIFWDTQMTGEELMILHGIDPVSFKPK